MRNPGPAALPLALALAAAPAAAVAAPTAPGAPAADAARVLSGTRFKCDVGMLTARFAARDAQFGAIVDAGDGPHFLAAQPHAPGPVKLTWTDGRRTLTWSPGVQIHFADGASHRMCGREGGHRH